MKASLLRTVLVPAGITVAQQASLPPCAQGCVTKFTTGSEIGGCGNLDIKCICSNTSFLSNIACCLASACNAADQQAAIVYAKQICNTAGVIVPDQVVCSSAVATSDAASSAASSASSPASSPASSVASSAALTSNTVAASTAFSTTSHILSVVTDLSVTSTTLSPTSTPFTVSSTLSSTVSTTASNLTTASNSTLSPGAEAGIGIGAASVIIVVVALLLLFFRRRRRSGGGRLDQEMYSPAPIDTTPEMETKANVHEISGKPASNLAIHVLSKDLSNEPSLWKNNAAEEDTYIVGNVHQVQRGLDYARQNPVEADSSAIGQSGLSQMHELDGLRSVNGEVNGESGSGAAYEVSGAVPEAPGYSAQEMEATSFYPAIVDENPNNLRSPASLQAQVSDVYPQAAPKGEYAAPSPQSKVARSPVTSKAIARKSLPISPFEGAQSSNAVTDSSGSSRLDILRTRIDKVREEKERLARLQELEYLEAELQREIMEEQAKELGTG